MLFDSVEVNFPHWQTHTYTWQLPLTSYKLSLTLPGFFFSSMFYFGLGAFTWWSARKLWQYYRATRDYFRAFKTSSRFLRSQKGETPYTAVVYGAATTVGKLYSLFLARKGFNLILVERDQQQLQLLESLIKKDTQLQQVRVLKVVIDRFDQDSMWRAFGGNREVKMHQAYSPVKVFVNCKNSKRKATPVEVERLQLSDSMMGESLMMDESGLRDDQKEALKQLWQPAITKEEVFFTSKENIEGFVCVLSYFLTQMVSQEVDHPCLINIDNHCPQKDGDKGEQGQLFFNSLVHFKDAFTSQLPKHCGDRVKTITVKTDFSNIPTSVDQQKVQDKLCAQSFKYLTIRPQITVNFPQQPRQDK